MKPRVAGLQCLSFSLQGLLKGFPLVLRWDTGPARASEDPTRWPPHGSPGTVGTGTRKESLLTLSPEALPATSLLPVPAVSPFPVTG